jgi:hypothetical protein
VASVCLERANFELILCAAPPAEWQIALSGTLALALSVTLGAHLACTRRRISEAGSGSYAIAFGFLRAVRAVLLAGRPRDRLER